MPITHMVATAAASVFLLVSGIQVLTPPVQPIKQEVAVNPVYPVSPDGNLIPWMTLLNRDKELYDLSATCEDIGSNPLARNIGDSHITGYPSYGILMYQPGTFLAYVKKYNAYPGAKDEPIEMPDKYLETYANKHNLGNKDRQILAAIYDPYIQMYVGRHMIDDGEGHQWSCYNKLALSEKYPIQKWKTPMESELVLKNLD